jgi:hypothetical protein
MGRTGDLNVRSGIYRSMCCHHELPVRRNEFLPECGTCHEPTRWAFITSSLKKPDAATVTP